MIIYFISSITCFLSAMLNSVLAGVTGPPLDMLTSEGEARLNRCG